MCMHLTQSVQGHAPACDEIARGFRRTGPAILSPGNTQMHGAASHGHGVREWGLQHRLTYRVASPCLDEVTYELIHNQINSDQPLATLPCVPQA